jgi:hypothetical protein
VAGESRETGRCVDDLLLLNIFDRLGAHQPISTPETTQEFVRKLFEYTEVKRYNFASQMAFGFLLYI